jgi:hypothetical protein
MSKTLTRRLLAARAKRARGQRRSVGEPAAALI